MTSHRFVVSIMPKPGILDPQGRAVEQSLPHLDVRGVTEVRVGRRVELTVEAPDIVAARALVERLAADVFANPIIETWDVAPASIVAASPSVAVG